jgi:hypothetical protein
MKSKPRDKAPITKPLLSDLIERDKTDRKVVLDQPSVGSDPLQPPDLYQDAGQGYNPDFTFPQE